MVDKLEVLGLGVQVLAGVSDESQHIMWVKIGMENLAS